MAQILLLQEKPLPLGALRKSLCSYHTLYVATSIAEAMEILNSRAVDLIISMIHLEKSNAFEFLELVKEDNRLLVIPFVCFCGRLSKAARALNSSLSTAADALGADKYLSLEQFRCADGFDYDRLRQSIESCLSARKL